MCYSGDTACSFLGTFNNFFHTVWNEKSTLFSVVRPCTSTLGGKRCQLAGDSLMVRVGSFVSDGELFFFQFSYLLALQCYAIESLKCVHRSKKFKCKHLTVLV